MLGAERACRDASTSSMDAASTPASCFVYLRAYRRLASSVMKADADRPMLDPDPESHSPGAGCSGTAPVSDMSAGQQCPKDAHPAENSGRPTASSIDRIRFGALDTLSW